MTTGRQTVGGLRRVLALPVPFILVGVALLGCAGPPKREYVLGAAAAPRPAFAVQTALPVIQVERVLLPDYLDTRDILTRRDSQVLTSESGRWAERLSVGVARALATFIGTRITDVVVTSTQPIDPPALRILVDVGIFEARGNEIVLMARWTITDGQGQRSLMVEQATLTEPLKAADVDSVVAAMSLAIEKLAIPISAGIEQNLDRRQRSRRGHSSGQTAGFNHDRWIVDHCA